jgi:hypothetical protein
MTSAWDWRVMTAENAEVAELRGSKSRTIRPPFNFKI